MGRVGSQPRLNGNVNGGILNPGEAGGRGNEPILLLKMKKKAPVSHPPPATPQRALKTPGPATNLHEQQSHDEGAALAVSDLPVHQRISLERSQNRNRGVSWGMGWGTVPARCRRAAAEGGLGHGVGKSFLFSLCA